MSAGKKFPATISPDTGESRSLVAAITCINLILFADCSRCECKFYDRLTGLLYLPIFQVSQFTAK